ncbi:unnamed protein product [Mycena citricolor]|uniref:Fungal lipase-type domain-containing protein n=1 Tax=Mycena citricolor TaxID=2018698 RepID=A0AAD2Q293_9AGAR|nr:unnamed protein product [Mycena citricolor]
MLLARMEPPILNEPGSGNGVTKQVLCSATRLQPSFRALGSFPFRISSCPDKICRVSTIAESPPITTANHSSSCLDAYARYKTSGRLTTIAFFPCCFPFFAVLWGFLRSLLSLPPLFLSLFHRVLVLTTDARSSHNPISFVVQLPFRMKSAFLAALLAMAAGSVVGAPMARAGNGRRLAPTTLTSLTANDLQALTPFVHFAGATYCGPADKLMSWTCGAPCAALPGFKPSLAGGMGNAVQFFFVGYYPTSKSIIVAHEGTDPLALKSDLTDLNVLKGSLNATLFPGAPAGIEVHSGFRDEHAKTADAIQSEVKKLLASTGSTQVTVVGHSLGGALSVLDSLSLRLNLPDSVNVNSVTFGTPRVGDDAFVSFFDSKVTDFKRVNNENDLVPIVPGRFLGFSHPKGEIHIVDDSTQKVVACPGNDDATDAECQIKSVPNILFGNIIDHLGPYNGIFLGTPFC